MGRPQTQQHLIMPPPVTFGQALRYWARLGCINFGGPAGQIALMHRELVEERGWIDEGLFLRALNFCMLLPGPEAQQLAVYIGWRLNGYAGGVVAGAFFVIPSILVLLVLSWLAVAKSEVSAVAGVFYGIAPVVVAIVAEAVWRIGRRALKHAVFYAIAAIAFAGGYFFAVPFPLLVLASALAGLLLSRVRPGLFCAAPDPKGPCPPPSGKKWDTPPLTHVVKMGLLFVLLWGLVAVPLVFLRGTDDVLTREAWFFTKAAFVTFGGAYAVLSYIADMAVNAYGWLSAKEMLLGLGLAESTPGPLIMVTEFIGFVAAWKTPAGFSPLLYGVCGGLVATYMTFLPCFLFVFAGAPYIEALSENRAINAALTAVSAAIVGVVLKLAVFFGVHTLFPTPAGLDPFALTLALAAFAAIVRFRVSMPLLVVAGAICGVVWRLAGLG